MALSIEAINEQFITLGTKNFDLVIDIGGDPDTVDVTGYMESFYSDWDAANDELHIKADEVLRLIAGVTWDVSIAKGNDTLNAKIKYNVIPGAPIFPTLPTINLYRNVPINIDILIANIPAIVIPNARLLGLKADITELGIKVTGKIPTGARFSFSTGNLTLIMPSTTGQAQRTKNYAYTLQSGTPPQIATPTFDAKGNYGELNFTDVNHAFGYEWQLGDAGSEWNFFDASRPIINPSTVEVTPGHLNVTITFPNIAAATAYEYQLVSEGIETLWHRFTGTLSNNMITTIIPDLEEGVEYDLKLRVASPWIGTPITLKVYGGRFCYTLQRTAAADTNKWLFIYHTGVPNGSRAKHIKQLRLPSAFHIMHAAINGLAVNSTGDVFVLHTSSTDEALYTFLAATIDAAANGSTLVADRRNPLPSGSWRATGMAHYEDKLYVYFSSAPTGWLYLRIVDIPTTNGAELTTSGGFDSSFQYVRQYGMSVTDNDIWMIGYQNPNYNIQVANREIYGTPDSIYLYLADGTTLNSDLYRNGLKVIGHTIYTTTSLDDKLKIYRINPEVRTDRYVLDGQLLLPTGLTDPHFLDIRT